MIFFISVDFKFVMNLLKIRRQRYKQNRKPPNNRQKNIDFLPKMINFAGEKA
jgi:hypothetical protein